MKCVAAILVGAGLFTGLPAHAAELTTTVYVGKHFEVRDHDQPVKFVFHGSTRVARITGTSAGTARVQRIRLYTGWNLCSLAVTAPDLVGQLARFTTGAEPLVTSHYRWQASTAAYVPVQAGDTVSAGDVLWLRVRTNNVVSVQGQYVEPPLPRVPTGGGYVQAPGFEVWSPELPPGVSIWKFNASAVRWEAGFTGDLAHVSTLPPVLGPGEPIYIHSTEAVELTPPDRNLEIAYYHQDHLGSSTALTDAAGGLIQETAYYPFGAVRHEHRLRAFDGHYQFAQKERDKESGLSYFEARHLAAPLARFLSFDPYIAQLDTLAEDELTKFLSEPSRLNPFAYALNNPQRYIDPNGQQPRPRQKEAPAPVSIEIREHKSDSRATMTFAPSSVQLGRTTLPGGGSESRQSGEPKPLSIVVTRPANALSPTIAKMAVEGKPIHSATIIMRASDTDSTKTAGEGTSAAQKPSPGTGPDPTQAWVKLELSNVHISSYSVSQGSGVPMESFTLIAGESTFSISQTQAASSNPTPEKRKP